MKYFWLLMFALTGLLVGCATQNGTMTLTAGTSTATISAPMPWWGEPTGYVSLDTPTTHTQAAYGVSKRGDTAIVLGLGGTALGGAFAGPFGAAASGVGGALMGAYIDGTTSDSAQSVAAQAIRRRASVAAPALPSP